MKPTRPKPMRAALAALNKALMRKCKEVASLKDQLKSSQADWEELYREYSRHRSYFS